MADIDIDHFGEHGKTDEMTDETFPLTPRGGGMDVVTHAQVHVASGKQETSFNEMSLRSRVLEPLVEGLCKKLSEKLRQNPEVIHFDDFEIVHRELYYKDKPTPLTSRGKLKSIGTIADKLGKEGLHNLGFDIPKDKLTARQAIILNRVDRRRAAFCV